MTHDLRSCIKKIFYRSHGIDDSSFNSLKRNGETRVLQPAHTIRLKPEAENDPAVLREKAKPTPILQKETSITWCGLTDTGRVRDHNEDYFSCIDLQESHLFVVADGMGGHDAGEVASRLAVETVAAEIRKGAKGKYAPGKLLQQAVQCANIRVLEEATGKGSNMGTTVTLALVNQDRAYIANVGDSRTYRIGNGSIKRITEDHSLVEKLVSVGRLTKEAARNHPKANILYRNIGSEPALLADIFEIPVERGANLLLCTDGLWGEVPDEVIYNVVAGDTDARKTCIRLVDLANQNGGKDNITAVMVKIM
jgi:protein phosphatase